MSGKFNKKAVVTGGAGFIGSHIAEELLKRNFQVIIIDDLSTGSLNNIKALSGENLEYIYGSITDLPLLQKLFSGVDYVFHQAAIASVPTSIDNPLASHAVNLTGTLNVLLAARDNRVSKVVYASSCAIYGNEPTIPKRENMTPDPQSPYAVTKLAAECYCDVFRRIYGLPTICLRYFNVYGLRQNPDSQYAAVIPKFIQRVLEGKPPIIFGDGEQSRDFVFVRDVVMANLLAAESNAVGVFNIGRGESITLNALAAHIIRFADSNVEPIYEEPRLGDVQHSLADISRAQTFGYQPQYSLEDGLKIVVRSFLQNSQSLLSAIPLNGPAHDE